jgi:uncharacterized protein YndB with AHSA1/START domain
MNMTEIKANSTAAADHEIVISRVFDAPRELVWKAWTDPKHVVNWWGPKGFSTTIEVMDVRPGGQWAHVMRGPDGTNYPNKSIFKEVVENERIVYSHGGGKEGGRGARFEATWTFETVGPGKTHLTVRMVFPTKEDRDFVVKEYGAIEGGKQTLGRLSEYLPTMETSGKPFILTRVFDAPRELVWKAWTERERLMEWFGPKGCTMSTANMDFRAGGIFHYCMKLPNGNEMWGKFVYREIVAPEKIVLVNSFSDAKGGLTRHPMSPTWPLEMLATTTFADVDGKTELTIRWEPLNATEEERRTFDAGRGGMTQGWTGALNQLDAYLKKS